jgi:cell division protein FtsQ
MKYIRQFFSIVKSVLGAACSPVWNHARTLRVLSNVLFGIAFLSIAALVFGWVGQRPIFSLNHINVESFDGRELKHINLPVIRSRVGEQISGNFFTVSLDQARQVFEAMPWVRKASVRRDWPNGIVVAIEEHQAMGVWASSTPKLMNTYGELFVANMAEAEDGASLLKFSGPEGSSKEVFKKLKTVNEWFGVWNTKVTGLELSSRYAWKAKLDNGMTIDLGRDLDERDSKQIELSVERLMRTWPQVQEKWGQRVDSIDLRYANGYAIHIGKKL